MASSGLVTCVNEDENAAGEDQLSIRGFDGVMWTAMIVSIAVLALTSSLITNFRSKVPSRLCLLYQKIWFFVAGLLQNYPDDGISTATRFLLGGWVLASMVFVKCYSGMLKGELLVSESKYIDNIQDLLRRPDVLPMVKGDSQMLVGLIANKTEGYDRILKIVRERSTNYTWENNIKSELISGRGAIFMEGDFIAWNLKFMFGNEMRAANRKLYVGKESYEPNSHHLVFYKGLPRDILEQIDYLTLRFSETGQETPRKRKESFDTRDLLAEERSQIQDISPLTVTFLARAFTVYLYGISLAIVSAIFEVVANEFNERKNRLSFGREESWISYGI